MALTSIMLHPHGHTLNLVFTSKLFYFGNLKPHDLRISDVLLTISYPYSSISPLLPLYLLSHPSRTSSNLFSWSLNAIAISLLYILNEKSDCPPFCPWELLHLNSGLQPHPQAISSIIYFLLWVFNLSFPGFSPSALRHDHISSNYYQKKKKS